MMLRTLVKGLAMITKRIMRFLLRCLVKYVFCFRFLRLVRYYFVVLFDEIAITLYAAALLLAWLFLIVDYDDGEFNTGNTIPKINEGANVKVWIYYILVAFLCWGFAEIVSAAIVDSISSDYFRGDYSHRLKDQLHASYLLQALASNSPFRSNDSTNDTKYFGGGRDLRQVFLPKNDGR